MSPARRRAARQAYARAARIIPHLGSAHWTGCLGSL